MGSPSLVGSIGTSVPTVPQSQLVGRGRCARSQSSQRLVVYADTAFAHVHLCLGDNVVEEMKSILSAVASKVTAQVLAGTRRCHPS